jgi:hypothetical protein
MVDMGDDDDDDDDDDDVRIMDTIGEGRSRVLPTTATLVLVINPLAFTMPAVCLTWTHQQKQKQQNVPQKPQDQTHAISPCTCTAKQKKPSKSYLLLRRQVLVLRGRCRYMPCH